MNENRRTNFEQRTKSLSKTSMHKVVVRPVLLHAKEGGRLELFLRKHLPILKERYWPTFWCFESRMQTVLASMTRRMIPYINYRREILTLPDNGEVVSLLLIIEDFRKSMLDPFQCLDWMDRPSSRAEDPICLFLPGLTGDSQSEYIKSFVNVASRQVEV